MVNKYKLEVTPVILPRDQEASDFKIENEAYTGDGKIINSDFLNDFNVEEGKAKVIKEIEKNKFGKEKQHLD